MNANLDNSPFPDQPETTPDRVSRLETRMDRFEQEMVAMKIDIATIKATMVTKDDLRGETSRIDQSIQAVERALREEINRQTWRLITYVMAFNSLLVGGTFLIASHFH
ncbi:MAG: hypothetical protein ACXU8N_00600 [Telluria sp.]